MDWMKKLMLAASVAFMTLPTLAADNTISGPVRVTDGDTIRVNNLRIRLQGLACPENREAGGYAATRGMIEITRGQTITCNLTGENTHNRMVAVCFGPDGVDLSAKCMTSAPNRQIS